MPPRRRPSSSPSRASAAPSPAQPEEKAVAEMFDAIVEEEAFSGQPPGRVATGELFGGEVAPLAAADAFSAARDAEAHRAASTVSIPTRPATS